MEKAEAYDLVWWRDSKENDFWLQRIYPGLYQLEDSKGKEILLAWNVRPGILQFIFLAVGSHWRFMNREITELWQSVWGESVY